jgi:signal transduction histidine kinase
MSFSFFSRQRYLAKIFLCLFFASSPCVNADYWPDGVAALWANQGQTEEAEGILALRDDWLREENVKEQSVWLQRILPETHFDDPVLVLANAGVDRVEVFLGEDLLYSFGALESGFARARAANAVHWIPLPSGAPGKNLQIRLRSGSEIRDAGTRPIVLYASATKLMRVLQRVTAGRMVLSLLFVIVGLYAAFAWAVRRRYGVRFSLWVAVLTVTLGSGLLLASLMEFLSPTVAAKVYYPGLLLMLLFPVALWRYMEESLGVGRWKLIRRCWQLQVVVCVGFWGSDLFGWRSFGAGAQMLGNAVLALQLFVGVGVGGSHFRKGDASNRWIALGVFLFSLAGLFDVIVALIFGNPGFELYPLGVLALVVLLAYDQERRAGESQRQLRRQAESLHRHQSHLEEQVESRTAQWKEATRAAEAASSAKSEFLSNMSHELRTPLNAILGHAQLLRADDGVQDSVRNRGEVIRQSGEHLLTLINDVLDLARVEAGRLEVTMGEVELVPLLSGVVEMLRPRAEQKGLEFSFHSDTPLPARIEGDERRLRQILLNLLGNAVKFTDQGAVRLEVTFSDAQLECRVIDSGPGLDPEEVERLFQPFEQNEGAKGKEGTGLGLAISLALARKMEGDIMVFSRAGKGSTFSFRCPCTILDGDSMEFQQELLSPCFTVERPAPLPLEYQALCDAVRIGDIEEILGEINRLRALYPEYLRYFNELDVLAKGFDIFALQQLLDIRS